MQDGGGGGGGGAGNGRLGRCDVGVGVNDDSARGDLSTTGCTGTIRSVETRGIGCVSDSLEETFN